MSRSRPVQVHYSGGERPSHCAFVHTAMVAAFKRVLYGYYTRAVIVLDGNIVASVQRITKNSVSIDWGKLSKDIRDEVRSQIGSLQ